MNHSKLYEQLLATRQKSSRMESLLQLRHLSFKAIEFSNLKVIKNCARRSCHSQVVRHILLATTWVKRKDLTKMEDPKRTKKPINLSLIKEIMKLMGHWSANDYVELETHIIESYGKEHIKNQKINLFYNDDKNITVPSLYMPLFGSQKEWEEFKLKLMFFEDPTGNNFKVFLYLTDLLKGSLKVPLVSFNQKNQVVYSFAKGLSSISFTITEHTVEVESFSSTKSSPKDVIYNEKTEKRILWIRSFTHVGYREKHLDSFILEKESCLRGNI